MARSISIYRRKPNLVDLLVRKRPDIVGFRFSAAANFDVAFSDFAVVPNYGLKSRSVPDVHSASVGGQFRDQARFLFDPADYVASASALIDGNPFFLRVASQNPDLTFNSPEAMHLVIPPSVEPNRAVVLSGTVPMAATLASSLEIQLPGRCADFELQNDGAAIMYVAFSPSGGEFRVDPVSSNFRSFEQQLTSVSQVFVRGDGGATSMSAIFTQLNNRPL